jgi:hypothetical protein
MDSKVDIPEICPLGGESGTVRCAQCCYLGFIHWTNYHYCKADRWDKGLPDFK